MVACNMFRCANILLTILFFLLINAPSIAAGKSPGTSRNPSNRSMTMLPKKEVMAMVSVFRFNVLVMGGAFNMLFSLINLILGLVNFYLIFGRYNSRVVQSAAKINLAVEELKNRELNPKIKMGLSREIPPPTNTAPLLTEVFALMKEPSPLFDGTNCLLDGQKEARLRKLNPEKDETTGKATKKAKSPKPKSAGQSNDAPKSPATTELKKNK